MADLLDGDGLDEVLVLGSGTAEVDALEQVLHHRAHLTELAAQALLQGIRGERIGLVGHDLIDELLCMEKHGLSCPPSNRCHAGTSAPPCSCDDRHEQHRCNICAS